MLRRPKLYLLFLLVALLTFAAVYAAYAWTPLPVEEDPLVRLPGTQPGQVVLEGINRCLNCHEGYDQAVEPGFNWKGSMMAQSARDFLFWACMTVAGQDSIWAVGRPNAMDICERCHFPKGWLEGRSDPPNASAMTGDDFDGIQCDFCHTMYDPFFETTFSGAREGSDWPGYWDESNASGTPSQPAAAATHSEDATVAQGITLFNGGAFYGTDDLPFSSNYVENGAGQFFVSPNSQKRASFADAEARHQMFYSRYHKSKYFCNACHDVSNPVLANLSFDGTPPGDGSTVLTTESESAYSYFHVERTFSEFMLSDYGQPGGASGIGPFASGSFATSHPADNIATCQDCHMPDVVGAGADKNGVPVRPGDSTEHPKSGQPLHDLTGGNAWVSWVLASSIPGSPNHDPVNDQLLNQGPAVLTLDLRPGVGAGFDAAALLAGADRARQQLERAASIQGLNYDPYSGSLSFRIQNQTGHKLISGFPEGRRMFVNVKAYAGGEMIYEVNPYDGGAGTLKGLSYAYDPAPLRAPCPLGQGYEDGACQSLEYAEAYVDEQVYEVHPSSSLTGEDETFHFALATGRYKDNRIPPKGFRIAEAPERLSEPVWHGAQAPGFFTAQEYAGGYDAVDLADYGVLIPGADYVEVTLYYQTTSREYIEFLRDEINGTASTLPDTAYIIQTDPFFAQLAAWGDTIWQLWAHNKEIPGAAPYPMAQTSIGAPPLSAVRLTAAEQTVPESQGTVTVTVELAPASTVPVTVPFTVGGTATAADDYYELVDTSFHIPAGESAADVTIDIVDDLEVEGDETVVVTLGTPQNAILGAPSEQTITIEDNDRTPVVRLTAAEQTVLESQGAVTVTVELTITAGLPVTVPFTVGGTATAADHGLVDGDFLIAAGESTAYVTFDVDDDAEVEGDETVVVTLGTPQNAILGTPAEQTITIEDNDRTPVVHLTSATQTVPESQGTVTVTVELTATAGVPVTVPFTLGGTASSGDDYYELVNTSFQIPAGESGADVTLDIVDDAEVEGDETVVVTLGTPQNAILGAPSEQTITIEDNDRTPVVRLTSAEQTVLESQGMVTVTVELTATAGVPVTVPYTVGGTASGADHDLADGEFHIPAGESAADVTLDIVDDAEVEGDETVVVTLGTPQNAILGEPSEQTITIEDNDRVPVVRLTAAEQTVPESQGTVTVTVELTATAGIPVTVPYTVGGTASGADHDLADGEFHIPAGDPDGSVTFNVVDDLEAEGDETVIVTLGTPQNANLGTPDEQTITIEDNDRTPVVRLTSAEQTVLESQGMVTVTVELTATAGVPVTVPFTLGGTASGDDYYELVDTSFHIAAGESGADVTLDIVDDLEVEGDETVVVTLGTPENAILGTPSQQTITIVDTDQYGVFLPVVLRQPAPLSATGPRDTDASSRRPFLAARRLRPDR